MKSPCGILWKGVLEPRTHVCTLKSQSLSLAKPETFDIRFTGYLIDVFSIHIIISVSLFLEKVFRSRKSVFIQQLASIFPYLIRLAFTFLLKAFYMTVKRFRQRVISKAVSLHSQMFYSRLTNTSTALFASSLTVCGQFQTADIKKYRHEKEIVRQCHGFNVKYHF